MVARDYSLLGASGRAAEQRGLAAAAWYHSAVPRETMKALMMRRDGPALRDSAVLFGAMAVLAGMGIALWPGLWSVPFWLAYGVLYGSAMDSRWHECGHGTAFRTRWMNAALYQVASFCMIRNPVEWKYSHSRHHSDTIIVGRDPEIFAMRPPALLRMGLNLFGLIDAWHGLGRMLRYALGRVPGEVAQFVPPHEHGRMIRIARLWTALYAAVIGAALVMGSWLPLMLVGLPRLYGAWHHVLTGLLQHAGLAEDVTDHRLNTRTVYMNPVSRFIYWNMNYHLEHHMFPMVPYHQLPALHAAIGHDLPDPSPSIGHALREILPILRRQLVDEDVCLRRALPPTARPYRDFATRLEG